MKVKHIWVLELVELFVIILTAVYGYCQHCMFTVIAFVIICAIDVRFR